MKNIGLSRPLAVASISIVILFSIIILLPGNVAAEDGEMDEGGFHVSLMLLAAFLGLISLLTGLRNSRIKWIAGMFPKEIQGLVPRIIHRWVSTLYYLVYFGTFVVWSIVYYSDEGKIYFTLHGQLGLISVILAITGIATGLMMWKRPARLWRLHWVFNVVSYVLMLVTIALGESLGD